MIRRAGEVVAESTNRVAHEHDVTRHAEVVAISQAQKALGSVSLDDCMIYVNAEPCGQSQEGTADYNGKIASPADHAINRACPVCGSDAIRAVEEVVELAIEQALEQRSALALVRSGAARRLMSARAPTAALLRW